jgi:hypothetical protein
MPLGGRTHSLASHCHLISRFRECEFVSPPYLHSAVLGYRVTLHLFLITAKTEENVAFLIKRKALKASDGP